MARECRAALARLLAVPDASRIVLAEHATHTLNLALHGLHFKPGDVVVPSVLEHNSVLRPLGHLQQRNGIEIIRVGLTPSGAFDVAAFRDALERRPALVVLNHMSNVTGLLLDIELLFKEARQAGAITLLDASQSLGLVQVRPREWQADMVAFTGHKALFGTRPQV